MVSFSLICHLFVQSIHIIMIIILCCLFLLSTFIELDTVGMAILDIQSAVELNFNEKANTKCVSILFGCVRLNQCKWDEKCIKVECFFFLFYRIFIFICLDIFLLVTRSLPFSPSLLLTLSFATHFHGRTQVYQRHIAI